MAQLKLSLLFKLTGEKQDYALPFWIYRIIYLIHWTALNILFTLALDSLLESQLLKNPILCNIKINISLWLFCYSRTINATCVLSYFSYSRWNFNCCFNFVLLEANHKAELEALSLAKDIFSVMLTGYCSNQGLS